MKSGMPEKPLISVCIANYNGVGIIDACIQSVLAQAVDVAVEILVHDDASTDGSATYIRSRYPDVILIESGENVGYCIANNRLVARASGDYVLLLNNDAALFPDALSALLAYAQALDTLAILGLPQYEWESGRLYDMGCLVDPFLNAVPNLDPRRKDVAMVAGACLWLPRRLWLELGGFPEWFGSVAEDLYLCLRARLAGYQVQALSTSGYRHRIGASLGGGKITRGQMSTTLARRALSERNRTFVMAMLLPTPIVQLMLPVHLMLLLMEGLLLSALKWNHDFLTKVYLPVFSATIQHRKRLSDARHQAQSTRKISVAAFLSVIDPHPYKLRMLLRHGLPHVSG